MTGFNTRQDMNCTYRAFLARVAMLTAASPAFYAADSASLEQRLNALEAQNQALRQELAEQKQTIHELQSRLAPPFTIPEDSDLQPASTSGFNVGRIHISGEGGVAYFRTGDDGQYPGGSFRVDEAKLFLEATLWEDTYFFSELDIVTREVNDEFFHLGELYVDFENVLRHWTDHNYLSVRVGRIEDVAGTYKLKAWHERLPFEMKEIVVPETGEVEVNFTLGIKGLPKY
jgi:hypothetical protein